MAAETRLESTPNGIVVHVGNRITLPGVYMNELQAKRGLAAYLNKQRDASRKPRRKKKVEDASVETS